MELSKMSLTELRRLQSKVEAEIRRRSDTARRELLKKMQKMAAEEGLTLDELLPAAAAETKPAAKRGKAKSAAKKSGPIAMKYRHPETPSVGWRGRGRKPQWVVDWLAQNKPLADLEIKAA